MPENYCSKCGALLSDRWEDGWPNYGRITLGYYANIGHQMGLKGGMADSLFAFKEGKAQEVVLQWGQGYLYNSEDGFRMCSACQGKLVKLVGEFFKAPDPAMPDDARTRKVLWGKALADPELYEMMVAKGLIEWVGGTPKSEEEQSNV